MQADEGGAAVLTLLEYSTHIPRVALSPASTLIGDENNAQISLIYSDGVVRKQVRSIAPRSTIASSLLHGRHSLSLYVPLIRRYCWQCSNYDHVTRQNSWRQCFVHVCKHHISYICLLFRANSQEERANTQPVTRAITSSFIQLQQQLLIVISPDTGLGSRVCYFTIEKELMCVCVCA